MSGAGQRDWLPHSSEKRLDPTAAAQGRAMRVRVAVVSFAPPEATLAVVGGCEALGRWEPSRAVRLAARLGATRLQSEPDFHAADVELPEGQEVEYKFLELHNGVKWEER